jgi:hypothetical protein
LTYERVFDMMPGQMPKDIDEIKTWLNAYNAALTGILASRQVSVSVPGDAALKPDANTISDFCVACADAAVRAFDIKFHRE